MPDRTLPLLTVTLLLLPSPARAGGDEGLTPLPPADSPLRAVAAEYKLAMNMLLFPDYFQTEEQFRKQAAGGFAAGNLPAVVRGLRAYGHDVGVPRSADEYRAKVYPQLLAFLKNCGYAAVEIPVGGAKPEQIAPLRREIERLGLGVTAVGGVGNTADPEGTLKARVDAAHALGSKVVVGPVVLPFRVFPPDVYGDERVAWVRGRLAELRDPVRRAAEYAKTKDVRLAVEPLNRFELPGLNRLSEAIDFVKEVDHPNFGVMIDTCHELSEGGGPEQFADQVRTLTGMGRLFHCHISAVHRGRVDRAWIDWPGLFGPLKRAGFRGYVAVEIFDAVEPYRSSVNVNRARFANPPEVALAALLHAARQLQQVK